MAISRIYRFLASPLKRRKYSTVKSYKLLPTKLEGGPITYSRLTNRLNIYGKRTIVGAVLSVIPRLLRVRYIFLGGVLSGGAAASKKYEEWKDKLPDTSWVHNLLPDREELNVKMKDYWANMLKSAREFQSHLSLPDQTWIPTELRKTITERKEFLLSLMNPSSSEEESLDENVNNNNMLATAASGQRSQNSQANEGKDVQEELITLQLQYQKEIDRLEKENKELRKQNLLHKEAQAKSSKTEGGKVHRTIRKSPIDMYSEVLDELSKYDNTYDTLDHLPRVVVVGDQSSGKTSVLEMVAQARIFPRGSGEMMTRAPVMVTLSEAPFHVAKFSDSDREYDLSKETELAALRHEVEIRMKNSVKKGQTISSEVISMTVKGPGLQRMVLVDLPGVISTMTAGMAQDTKSSIINLCRKYMENPNAIILCIQDGSIDAERSNVTELVSSIDTEGKRTIFVLTKVDVAETGLFNPERIKMILDGKLFPMKAMGYYAVVTGRGNQSDSIQAIKEYEEEFFKQSKLFRSGILKPSQMTTRNLSLAVSAKFWKMVQDSIEQQADEFKATRYNLETEWRNTYPGERELSRIELFEKAKGEILDELINLSQIKSKDWEDEFMNHLWNRSRTHMFEAIYIPSSTTSSLGTFNTSVDIKLKQWADRTLPQIAVEVGTSSLREKYLSLLKNSSNQKSSSKGETESSVAEPFKVAVVDEVFRRHQWDNKAEESLRILQQISLENKSIYEKQQWESAVSFMESSQQKMLESVDKNLQEMTGPSVTEQWTKWTYRTPEQNTRLAVKSELEKLLGHEKTRKSQLSQDELITVTKNLQTQKVTGVTESLVLEIWHQVYRKHFLNQALTTARMCRKAFAFYQKSLSAAQCGLDCKDVILFWRIQQMIQVTSGALAQQLINHEARRLERIMRDVVDDFGDDNSKLEHLISGHRIKLAEDLQRVRRIQEKLEELILVLNRDKS